MKHNNILLILFLLVLFFTQLCYYYNNIYKKEYFSIQDTLKNEKTRSGEIVREIKKKKVLKNSKKN